MYLNKSGRPHIYVWEASGLRIRIRNATNLKATNGTSPICRRGRLVFCSRSTAPWSFPWPSLPYAQQEITRRKDPALFQGRQLLCQQVLAAIARRLFSLAPAMVLEAAYRLPYATGLPLDRTQLKATARRGVLYELLMSKFQALRASAAVPK